MIMCEWKSKPLFRQLTHPSTVDGDKVSAVSEDGMLQLTLPKTAEKDAAKIAVAAGNSKHPTKVATARTPGVDGAWHSHFLFRQV